MDIEEYKKLARNKIEADALTKQVRDVIKETKWQKQDMREGFKETFKPLIKSQDSIKKSIDEQQNATIAQLQANQLALTQGLNQNRLAFSQGLDKLNNKIKNNKSDEESDEEYKDAEEFLSPKDFDRYLTSKEVREILNKNFYFYLPSEYAQENLNVLDKFADDVNDELLKYKKKIEHFSYFKNVTRYIQAFPSNNNLSNKNLEDIKFYNVLSVYSRNLNKLYNKKLYNN